MPPELRAIIFDLDDTLYPLEAFVLSGFDAVADHLHRLFDVDEDAARRVMRDAHAGDGRGRELQACLQHFDLPASLLAPLVLVIRAHRPAIALPEATAAALSALWPRWRLAVITNGDPAIQRRKIEALGLAQLVDAVVYADAERAKPAAAPFLEAAAQLGVPCQQAIVVGNDPLCDIYGAWRVGMKTIHVAGGAAPVSPVPMADASVRSLVEVPDIAERLVA